MTTKTAILGVLVSFTLACSGATFTVEMLGGPNRFAPQNLTVNVGDTVTWINHDPGRPHSSTSNSGVWDSDLLFEDDTFSHTFDSSNVYGYYGAYTGMTGQITVLESTTNLAKVFTYGLDLIAQRDVSTGARSFYGYDGNGNTRYLTSTNGTVTDTYVYDAFGTLLASTGSTPNDYLFTGEQRDAILGLYYLRVRYLNSGRAILDKRYPSRS